MFLPLVPQMDSQVLNCSLLTVILYEEMEDRPKKGQTSTDSVRSHVTAHFSGNSGKLVLQNGASVNLI